MDRKTLKELVSSLSEWNEEFLDFLKSQGERIEKTSGRISKYSPLIIRGILFGFGGFIAAIIIAFVIGFTLKFNPYMLAAILSFLFSTGAAIYGLYTGRGGMEAVRIANSIQNIDEELKRIRKDIKRLKKEDAPQELIDSCWKDYGELRKKRFQIVRAKSLIDVKKIDKQIEREVNETPLLPPPNEELQLPPLQKKVEELERETLELREKINLYEQNKN